VPTGLVAVTHQVLLVDVQRLAHVPIGQFKQWPQAQARPEVPELTAGTAPWADYDISRTISAGYAGKDGRTRVAAGGAARPTTRGGGVVRGSRREARRRYQHPWEPTHGTLRPWL